MWKKLLIAFIALAGTFTVGYAYYSHSLNAVSGSYYAGGNVTGRINKAPSNLTGTKANIGMKKGDRYYLGKNTYSGRGILFPNISLGWQLLTDSFESGTVSESSWLAMTTKPIAKLPAFDSFPTYYAYVNQTTKNVAGSWSSLTGLAPYHLSNLKPVMDSFNLQWSDSNLSAVIGTHTKTRYENLANAYKTRYPGNFDAANTFFYGLITEYAADTNMFGKNSFLTNLFQMHTLSVTNYQTIPQSFKFTSLNDTKFYYDGGTTADFEYFMHDTYEDMNTPNGQHHIATAGYVDSGTNEVISSFTVRPAIFIQKDPVVFAVSELNNASTLGMITQPSLPNGYTNIAKDAIGSEMKIRRYDSSMNVSLDANLMDLSGNLLVKKGNVFQAFKNKSIQIRANGNTAVPDSTISVLVFDKNGDFVAYAPLGEATGSSNDYIVNLAGLEAGLYQLAVVNEEYDSTKSDPARSSLISNVISLEIVETLSDLTFTAKNDLLYNSNVDVGDTVGTISSQNGAGTPAYTIIADPAYPNEYNDIKLASDGKTVVVNSSPLHAGTYHFKVQAQDGNGDPDPALEINASFTVNQANLTVAFDDPNQTKKSITQATTGWSEAATANPSTNTKVTYAKSGGSVGLINIDPDSGMITYAGSGGYGKVTIKAAADDVPSSGFDDYNSADTTKEIVIYREVDGNVTPHTNSSSTTAPTFQTSDANVKPNGIIGNVLGTLGTPDNGTSGATTYTYGLKNVDDYNYFSVNPSTGEIKTTADLSTNTGNYNITVTVSDKWSTKEISVPINVGLAGAEDLSFYETSAAIKKISSKSAKITDTGVTVFATVKGSSNTNPVTYKIKDGSTNVITVNPSSGAVTMNGVGTVTIVAEKAGASGQADARSELSFTVTAGEQAFIYTDDAGNELPKSGANYQPYTETYASGKSFQLYTSGNPSGSTVTYQLKAGSPSDVIQVDSDGKVHILNASLNNQKGNVIVQATSHDPSGNYSDKTIELPIDIDKGTRVIAFEKNPITVVNGSGSIVPNILSDGVLDTDGNTMIEIDPSEDNSIAWTNDNGTIQYNWNDASGKDIKLHATKPTDRNYKEAKADGTLHILGADEASLTITSPGKITYGDHFTIRSTQDDSMSSNVQYSFETDNQVFISTPQVNGKKAEFDAIGNSGNTEITITVTRTADGELPLSKKVKIKVLPKPITIEIEDKEKKRLEDNPELTYKDFKDQLVEWNGVKDTINESVIKLSTTANKYSPIGSYPIKDGNQAIKQLNENYPNYTFTIKEGLLNVLDNGNKDFWDIDDDGCPDLNIQIKDESGSQHRHGQ